MCRSRFGAAHQIHPGRAPFHGGGYRKVCARLRHDALITSKKRVLHLISEYQLGVRSFSTVEELRQALLEFKSTYNENWIISVIATKPQPRCTGIKFRLGPLI